MRGSAFRSVENSGVCGALPLMAHPHRWANHRTMHRGSPRKNRTASGDMRGMTLTEVLCLLVLAAIVLIVVTPKRGHHGSARIAAAMTQIATFTTQLAAFRDDNGFFPSGKNGLQDLIRQPAGATNWRGPYAQSIPKDPWGQDYVYECPAKHTASDHPYDLLSLGPPGENTPLGNWVHRSTP
jgi:general secretion pathway protein G